MGKRISKTEKEEIINSYKSKPITISDIAKRFSLSNPTIFKILKEYNVKTWSKAQLLSPDLDTSYFKSIDNQSKAYYLGLLTTDGCLFWKTKTSAFFSLELKAEDYYMVADFLNSIKCNKKIIYSEKSDSYAVQIHCTEMVKDLQQYNLEPRSSTTQRLSDKIDDVFVRDYIRGLFDGDGSFGFYSRPNRSVHRKIIRISSGSSGFISDVAKTITLKTGASMPSVYYSENDHCYTAAWTKVNDLEAIIDYIYYDGCKCLKRKQKIAQKIVDEIRQYRDNRIQTAS